MKNSFVLLFLLCSLSSAFTLVPGITHYVYVVSILYCIGGSLFLVAVAACFVTSLQLGLDQMPDASSSSFIAWFLFSIYAVFWIPNVSNLPIVSNTLYSSQYRTGLSNFTVCSHLRVRVLFLFLTSS